MIDSRVREERARYASFMGWDTESESVENIADADEEMRLERKMRLARDLPSEAADMPFVDWYVEYWLQLESWAIGFECLSKAKRSRILNVDALIEVLSTGDIFKDWERDQIPGFIEIVEKSVDLWCRYKNVRHLNQTELKCLSQHLDMFVKRWGVTEYDCKEPLPHQTVSGRGISLDSGNTCSIKLGFGNRLRIQFAFDSAKLLSKSRFQLSEINETWVETGYRGVSRERHVAVIEIREMALNGFLKSECTSCFKPDISNLARPGGMFVKDLIQEINVEYGYLDNWLSSASRSRFHRHAVCLKLDAVKLTADVYRLFTSRNVLKSEIKTGECDHIDEHDITEIDSDVLMRTIAYGLSAKGD